jgi:hypothetical protein
MKTLLKRALAVLESHKADEFTAGACVMVDIRAELAKGEPAKTSKNEILHHSLDFVQFCWRELNLNDYAEELRSKLEDDLVAELAKPEHEASAPALLDALINMVDIAEQTVSWFPENKHADGPLIQARAAISKALGETK